MERELIEGYERGMSVRQAGESVGVGYQRVFRFLRGLGIVRNRQQAAVNRWRASHYQGDRSEGG